MATLAATACGGSGTGVSGNHVSGTVQSNAMAALDAVSVVDVAYGVDFNNTSALNVLVLEFGQACAKIGVQASVRNSQNLYFGIVKTDASGAATAATAPGTYQVVDYASGKTSAPNALMAEAFWEKTDTSCTRSAMSQATTGTVTLTSVTSTDVQGTFNLTFADGSLSGSFDAPSCASWNPNSSSVVSCQ